MGQPNRRTHANELPQRVVAIVNDAEKRFSGKALTGVNASPANVKTRQWAISQCLAAGFGLAEIAGFFSTTTAAVKAVLRIPPVLEADEDEHEEVATHAPARMLPIYGERQNCANESECLGELLRACAPHAPRYASCPAVCLSFSPPTPRHGPSPGQWQDERFPAALGDESAPIRRAQVSLEQPSEQAIEEPAPASLHAA